MGVYNWADIGGFRFEGSASADPFHGGVLSGLRGWRGLPGARGDAVSIPGAHGTFDRTNIFREGRSMELRGGLVADTPLASAQLLDALEAAVAAGPVVLRVSDATGVWEREVEVLNLTTGERWIDARFPVTLDLYAPDPVRYRQVVTLGPVGLPEREGGLTLPAAFPWYFGTSTKPEEVVVNDGQVSVFPTSVIRGSGSAVAVRGGARELSFGSFSGELVLDSRSRRAWLNGSDVTKDLLRRDWHEVGAGETQAFSMEVAAAGQGTTLTVEYRVGAW